MPQRIDKEELVKRIRELEGLNNDEKSTLLELLNSSKKYGLVWEEKVENTEEALRDNLPVLAEDKTLALTNGGEDAPNHILIEGDNLEALTTLSYTHEGKIDVIYIDPPYNTGNKDFVYNDSFVDSEDSYRHSKWLSFMSKRLRIAKHLLSDRGVIFISIDDNEQANLKLLCDEVFGEDKFMGDVSWQRSYSPRNDSKGISNEKEHILVYSRLDNWIPGKLPRTESMDSKYKNPDNDFAKWRSSDAFAPSAASHQGMVYAIQHPNTGELIYPYKGACWPLQQDSMHEEMNKWAPYKYKLLDDDDRRAAVCGVSVEDIRKGIPAIVLAVSIEESQKLFAEIYSKGPWPKFFFSNKGKGGIARKTYITNVSGKNVTNLWLHSDVGHTDEAKKEIAKIFGGEKPFDTPKPTRLIQRIIQISASTTSIVLDFFAGSGTTLHAVMQLNQEDGGKRQCILVTNNENNICRDVTYERNKRVINGYTTPKGQEVEGLKQNNLRYYRTHLLPRERTNRNMRALVNASTDLLCIKENIFEEFQVSGFKFQARDARLFSDGKRAMMVIYNEEVIPDIVEWLQSASANSQLSTLNSQLKTYVFSPGPYAWDDDFAPVIDRVDLCALPEAIYQAYKTVLPKKKVRQNTAEGSPNDAKIEKAQQSDYNHTEKGGKNEQND